MTAFCLAVQRRGHPGVIESGTLASHPFGGVHEFRKHEEYVCIYLYVCVYVVSPRGGFTPGDQPRKRRARDFGLCVHPLSFPGGGGWAS